MTTTLPDTLTVIAQSIESVAPADAPPAWAEIVGPLDEPRQMRWHPDVEGLAGFVAPLDCSAIVTVGFGWAHSLGDGTPAGRALLGPDGRRRCRVVCAMTRSGEVAGYLRDGPDILIDEAPTVGRIIDYIRRAFCLPTAEPEESTSRFVSYMWLSNVRGAGRRADRALPWSTVIGQHPAMKVAEEAGLTIPYAQVVPILRMVAETWTWSYLVEQAASPGWLADLLPPGTAGWMDEGVFSRWLLGNFSDIMNLLDQITPLIEPAAAKRLRRVLKQLDVLDKRPHPSWGHVSNT
ncbi:MAG: hypothetical protein QOG97_3276 [Acidimicrobiaceae bacterium]|nr:hypothetical protein [Acidimicrobiaceae bacterium]